MNNRFWISHVELCCNSGCWADAIEAAGVAAEVSGNGCQSFPSWDDTSLSLPLPRAHSVSQLVLSCRAISLLVTGPEHVSGFGNCLDSRIGPSEVVAAADESLESLFEVLVEDGVDERVDERVDVT